MKDRRVIPATCAMHGSTKNSCNLAVTREGDDIVLDPHVTGACVLILDKVGSAALFDQLGEWLHS